MNYDNIICIYEHKYFAVKSLYDSIKLRSRRSSRRYYLRNSERVNERQRERRLYKSTHCRDPPNGELYRESQDQGTGGTETLCLEEKNEGI